MKLRLEVLIPKHDIPTFDVFNFFSRIRVFLFEVGKKTSFLNVFHRLSPFPSVLDTCKNVETVLVHLLGPCRENYIMLLN